MKKLKASLKKLPGLLVRPFSSAWQWFLRFFQEEFVLDVWFAGTVSVNPEGIKTITRQYKQFTLTAITKKTQTHIIGKDANGYPFEIRTVEPFDFTITKTK